MGTFGVLLAPAAAFLGLALDSGGFFPDATAVASVVFLVAFAARLLFTPHPFTGLTPGLGAVAVALIILAAWTLASGSWSGAPARATLEYGRTLLYVVVFVLSGSVGRSARRARVMLYGLTSITVAVSIAAAGTWLLPHLFPTTLAAGRARLSWPTSYWNAAGLIAGLAVVWSTGVCCSATASARVRVLAAMAIPIPAATLIFTASRGAVAVTLLGLVLTAITIRSPATVSGILTLIATGGAAGAIALSISGLNVDTPTASAIRSGRGAFLALLALTAAAGALRGGFLRLDARLDAVRLPWTKAQFRAAVTGVAAGCVVAFLALGGPRRAAAAVHEFAAPSTQSVAANLPSGVRLLKLGSNHRVDSWRVALVDGFGRHPVLGSGAGTYATLWTRYGPPRTGRILNAHSLYLEELAELGLVGGGLIIIAVAASLVALARRARGPGREVWAALLVGAVMWAVHAGVDWDWQMPAVTTWFFAVGGLALAAPAGEHRVPTPIAMRFGAALGCLILAVTPVLIWRSQTRLIAAVSAFERGDCLTAERDALASNAALSSREDPFEIISYCETASRQYALALSAIHAAELRDPQNWELWDAEALISALAGRNPLPAARAALQRYPSSPITQEEVRVFSGPPRLWRRFALRAPLPLTA